MQGSRTMFLPLLLFLAVLAISGVHSQSRNEWDAPTYPNPTADGFQRCNMRSTASVCDPDAVLTEQQRYRLNYELTQLESRTRQPGGSDFCEKKGIVAAVALAKHVRGASENAVKSMANDMLQRWTLDKQCRKSMVIVMAVEDRKFWVARDSRVPVYGSEFTDLFNEQKPLFAQGNYDQALLNIVQGTWDKALAKQTPVDDTGIGGGRQTPFSPAKPDRGEDWDRGGRAGPGGFGGGKGGFSIPWWFWFLLVLVIIPLVCCCCCVYFFCCRRKKNSAAAPRQGPSDIDPEVAGGGGVPTGRGGGGRGGGGLQGFLGGMGGAAAGNVISNFFSGRGGRGRQSATGGGYGPTPTSGNRPDLPHPSATKGGGLYPSTDVKDEGGGGGW